MSDGMLQRFVKQVTGDIQSVAEKGQHQFILDRLWLRCIAVDVAKNKKYPCLCGEPPYTDGEQCPKCLSLWWLEQNKTFKEIERAVRKDLKGR